MAATNYKAFMAYLSESQIKAIKKITEQTGIPGARIIRDGVDLILKQHGKRGGK